MGLLAARAATRMQTRQMYRTASRMQRRRSNMQARAGMRQDFEPAGGSADEAPAATGPAQPAYVAELEQLASLRDQGVITADDFEAKKRQLLGI